MGNEDITKWKSTIFDCIWGSLLQNNDMEVGPGKGMDMENFDYKKHIMMEPEIAEAATKQNQSNGTAFESGMYKNQFWSHWLFEEIWKNSKGITSQQEHKYYRTELQCPNNTSDVMKESNLETNTIQYFQSASDLLSFMACLKYKELSKEWIFEAIWRKMISQKCLADSDRWNEMDIDDINVDFMPSTSESSPELSSSDIEVVEEIAEAKSRSSHNSRRETRHKSQKVILQKASSRVDRQSSQKRGEKKAAKSSDRVISTRKSSRNKTENEDPIVTFSGIRTSRSRNHTTSYSGSNKVSRSKLHLDMRAFKECLDRYNISDVYQKSSPMSKSRRSNANHGDLNNNQCRKVNFNDQLIKAQRKGIKIRKQDRPFLSFVQLENLELPRKTTTVKTKRIWYYNKKIQYV